MIQRRPAVVLAAALLAVLAACDPAPPGPPDPPQSTPSATATASSSGGSSSGTPTVDSTPITSQEELDYQAAAKAFRRANKVVDQALMKGLAEPPDELEKYADPKGDYYDQQWLGIVGMHDDGLRFDAVSTVVRAVPAEDSEYSEKSLRLYVCTDGREIDIIDAEGKVVSDESGDIVDGVLSFKRNGPADVTGEPTWRVWGYHNDTGDPGLEPVDKCQGPS